MFSAAPTADVNGVVTNIEQTKSAVAFRADVGDQKGITILCKLWLVNYLDITVPAQLLLYCFFYTVLMS